jgi:hypothetical protein
MGKKQVIAHYMHEWFGEVRPHALCRRVFILQGFS